MAIVTNKTNLIIIIIIKKKKDFYFWIEKLDKHVFDILNFRTKEDFHGGRLFCI